MAAERAGHGDGGGVAIDRDGEIYRGTGTYHRLSGRVSVEADHRCRS